MNKLKLISLLVMSVLLLACQTTPKQASKLAVAKPVEVKPARPLPFKEPKRIAQELDEDLVYSYLIGEIAARRGALKTSVAHYLYAAMLADDPYAAERATRIAIHLRDYKLGLRAARRWVKLAPNSLVARQLSAILFVRNDDIEGAKKQLEALIAIAEARGVDGFVLAATALNAEEDQVAPVQLLNHLVDLHPQNHRAFYAQAIVHSHQKNYGDAEKALRKAIELKADRALPHILLSRNLITQGRRDQALQHLGNAVATFPTNKALRTSYARQLVSADRMDAALQQFRELHRRSPKDLHVAYGLAMLATQEEQWQEARGLWQQLRNNPKLFDEATYFLGQVEELTKHIEKAIGLYAAVKNGELKVDALIRRSNLLAEKGRLTEMRDILQQSRLGNPSRAIDLYLTEATLLQGHGADKQQVLNLYADAISAYPESNELLYNRGLYRVDLDDMAAMEADFQAVLARDADHVNALNALGYTLADKGVRLNEAYVYVSRALKLMPDNAAILDSMGWVHYRMGDFENAIKNLRAAAAKEVDDEIAAHLGEVLWVSGDQSAAQNVWRKALQEKPESTQLKAILKRFKVTP